MIEAVRLGAASGGRRLARRSVVVTVVAAWLLTVAIALVEHHQRPIRAPTRTLHAAMGVVLPLLSFYLVGRVTARRRLGEASWAWARFGWSRRGLAGGEILLALALSTLAWVVATAMSVPLAYGGQAGAMADLAATLPVAALGGLAYASCFAAGASFFSAGRGRWGVLVADWWLGGSVGVFAVPWPRGHLGSLLGGPLVTGWSPRVSSLVLVAITVGALSVVALRAGR